MNTAVTSRIPPRAAARSKAGDLLRQHQLLAYFVLTNAVSWPIEFLLIASDRGWLGRSIPFSIHYLASLGPMASALVLTGVLNGQSGLHEMFRRMALWRVGLSWSLVSILSPAVLFGIAAVIVRMTGGDWPDIARLGDVNYLPNLGLGALALWIVTFGFGEETGWRGYALPRLQSQQSALAASLTLTAFWVVWHVPSFFYLPSYTSLGVGGLVGLIIGIASGSILFTWLYNSTGGSILMVSLWHAIFDLFTASEASQAAVANGGSVPMIMSIAVMVWAVAVVIWARPANLSRAGKQIHAQQGPW